MSAPSATASRPMGFAASALLRAGEERTEETLGIALAHPGARLHLTREGKWLFRGMEEAPETGFTVAEARSLGGAVEEAILLGWTPGELAPRLALALPAGDEVEGDVLRLDLRALGMAGRLAPAIEAELGQGQHLLNWHARARHCGTCGAPTRSALAGYRRDCTACGHVHFPRTDPVVIMLVHDGDGRCVLGRQRHFVPGMWSCLAGFVEPGETIEDAVRREVLEEVGLTVGRVAYQCSQPWPFPGSLMIGCMAQAQAGTIRLQESELEAARWFGREEVRQMSVGDHPEGLTTPNAYAIAHHLVRAFADG